jgi:hypothetical protein
VETTTLIQVAPDDIDPQWIIEGNQNTQMSGHDRIATRMQAEYVEHMRTLEAVLTPLAQTDEQREALRAELAEHRDGYIQRLRAWMAARSRCASRHVVGGSGLNRSAMERRNDTEHNRMVEFMSWKERGAAVLRKRTLALRPAEALEADETRRLIRVVDETITMLKRVERDPIYDRGAFTSGLAGKLRRAHANGHHVAVAAALKRVRERQGELQKPVFAPRNAVWKLEVGEPE